MTQPTRPAPGALPSLGEQVVRAIAERDATRLASLFATPVVFRGVTPGRFWEAGTPDDVVEIALGAWFDPGISVTAITSLETGTVGDVEKVSYRMAVAMDTGPAVVEQVGYYSVEGGLITQMRLVCSGFRPVSAG